MNTLLFSERHIGISPEAEQKMLAKIGLNSLEELIDKTLPRDIRLTQEPEPIEPMSEARFAEHIAGLAAKTSCSALTSDKAGTAASHRPLFSAMFSKTPAGTLLTLPIRPKFRKAGWKLCCISKPWFVN